jgi:hypothetical protein
MISCVEQLHKRSIVHRDINNLLGYQCASPTRAIRFMGMTIARPFGTAEPLLAA